MGSPSFGVRTHAVSRRVARNFDGLFPGRQLADTPHTVVTFSMPTKHRQSAMSVEMTEEREACFEILVDRMTKFHEHLLQKGVWCDFVDPSTGAPFHTDSATTLTECDERYKMFGFDVLELGCCRCLVDPSFGQNVVMTSAFVEADEDALADALAIL